MNWNEAMRYHGACRRMAETWCRRTDDADRVEDLTHDLLIHLVERVDLSRAKGPPAAYVAGALWNAAQTIQLRVVNRLHRDMSTFDAAELAETDPRGRTRIELCRPCETAEQVRILYDPDTMPAYVPPAGPIEATTAPEPKKGRATVSFERPRKERKKKKKEPKPPRQLQPCGTLAAYRRGCRCADCGEARRLHHAAYRARKRAAAGAGSISGAESSQTDPNSSFFPHGMAE
jgi:hypothetical protein